MSKDEGSLNLSNLRQRIFAKQRSEKSPCLIYYNLQENKRQICREGGKDHFENLKVDLYVIVISYSYFFVCKNNKVQICRTMSGQVFKGNILSKCVTICISKLGGGFKAHKLRKCTVLW